MTKNLAALMDTTDIFTASGMQKVSSELLREKVFENLPFCLLEERARIIREIGVIIETDY